MAHQYNVIKQNSIKRFYESNKQLLHVRDMPATLSIQGEPKIMLFKRM